LTSTLPVKPAKRKKKSNIAGWIFFGFLLVLLIGPFFNGLGVVLDPKTGTTATSTVLGVLPNVLTQGLILGFVVAIIALGYTMVYGVLQLINFAHSEVFATGAVVGYEIFTFLQDKPINPFLKLVIVLVSAMVISGTLNVLIERIAYRPLRGAKNKLVPLISAIGVSFLLQDLLRLFEGIKNKQFNLTYPVPAELTAPLPLPDLFQKIGVTLNVKEGLLIVIAVVMLIGLNYLVNFTKMGKAIRAVAQDRQTAALMGIDANQMVMRTFLIGGALGGVAGVLYGLQYGTVNAYVGIFPGLKAFTAAVLGGIGSIPGAVLGGLVLGVIEQYLGTVPSLIGQLLTETDVFKALKLFGVEYKDIGAFLVLIIILIFKPTGLLGRSTTEKV
jgi:branched-chain amino acid transport system permease protein